MKWSLPLVLACSSLPAAAIAQEAADEAEAMQARMPDGPLMFGCRFTRIPSQRPETPLPSSVFLFFFQPGSSGVPQFHYIDPDGLLDGVVPGVIDQANRGDDEDGEFWIVTARLPMQRDDLAFAVYPEPQQEEGEQEQRSASIGRPLDNEMSMGRCLVFRDDEALEGFRQNWPEEQSE